VITAAIGGAPPPTLRLQSKSAAGETVPIDVSTIVLYSDDSVAAVIHLCRPADGRLPAAAAAAGQPPLTLREQQVLGCLCDGHSTHEIAAKLKISETTVRNHVQHLLDKLAVHSRAEVVALAYHDNLLS
jgi:DNA-binding NarL/FixJ family response regulator